MGETFVLNKQMLLRYYLVEVYVLNLHSSKQSRISDLEEYKHIKHRQDSLKTFFKNMYFPVFL